MIKHDLEKINLDNPLEGKMPQLIEYFVEFYGEKYRKRITDRLTNTTLVFANIYRGDSDESIDSIKHSYDVEISEKLQAHLKEKFNAEIISDSMYYDVLDARSWTKMRTPSEKKKLAKFLNGFSIYKDLTAEDLQDEKRVTEIREFTKDVYAFLDDLFKQRDVLFSEEKKQYIKTCEEKEKAVIKDYQNKINQLVCEYFLKHYKIDFTPKNVKEMLKLVPTFVDFAVKNPDFVSDFDKDRYGFMIFKLHSLEGDKSTSYKPLTTKQIYDMKLDDEFGDFLYNLTELQNRRNYELSNIQVPYEELSEKNLIDKEFMLFDAIDALRNGDAEAVTYFTTSYEEPNKTHAVCVFNSFYHLSSSDIIHELNHVIEGDVKLSKDVLAVKTGFRFTKQHVYGDKLGDIFYPDIRNDATAFNEIVNDYLTIKINDILVKDNFSIGNMKLPTTGSLYAYLFPIFGEFIDENLKEIIRCRMSNKPGLFKDVIGKENFQKLAFYCQKVLDLYMKGDMASELFERPSLFEEIEKLRGDKSIFEIAKNPEGASTEAKQLLDYVNKIGDVFKRIQRAKGIAKGNKQIGVEDERKFFKED